MNLKWALFLQKCKAGFMFIYRQALRSFYDKEDLKPVKFYDYVIMTMGLLSLKRKVALYLFERLCVFVRVLVCMGVFMFAQVIKHN